MNSLEIIFLDSILVTFPILVYLIYLSTNKDLKNKKIYKNLMLISSFFLVYRFGFSSLKIVSVLMLNLVVILSYKEKNIIMANIFSCLILIINFNYFNFIWIFVFMYILFILLFLTLKNNRLLIIIYTILNVVFYLIWVYKFNSQYFDLYSIISAVLCYVIIVNIMNGMYKIGEKILEFHMELKDLKKENQIKLSLFKITHEIKNPIAVCKGYIDMIDIENKRQTEKYVSIIKSEIDRLLVLLQDFLSINKCNMDFDIMDFNLLIEDNIEKIKPILLEKNIRTNINLLDDEIYVSGDYNRLSQVIINVLKNSIEAINSSEGLITIKSKIKNNNYMVMIEDNGEGMTKEIINKMKEPFFTTKFRGSGLGTSLIYEIIEAHDGKVSYTSEYGKGTCVTISIPIYE